MKPNRFYGTFILTWAVLLLAACQEKRQPPATPVARYTCPMPRDSFFSDHPGHCPKCGMELVRLPDSIVHPKTLAARTPAAGSAGLTGYTCPMHPQVHSDTAGSCPICGMRLERIRPPEEARSVSLETLLKPVNREVVSAIPMVHLMDRSENIELAAYGLVNYDPRQSGSVVSNVSGRLERLYVTYRFQPVKRGQKIADIYSPELLTAQENLLFLLRQTPVDPSLVESARQKLWLLGMSPTQLAAVERSGKPDYAVSVFSPYAGHIHESDPAGGAPTQPAAAMGSQLTSPLSLKEGMYVARGQTLFSVFNPSRAWAVLNVLAGQASLVQVGDTVLLKAETMGQSAFRGRVDYIEPLYRNDSKTLTVRVYFDNSRLQIPIGSQVTATIYAGTRSANWLPEEAVLSLGLDRVVFVRSGEAFEARQIRTGIVSRHLIQVLEGLRREEAVAANAQYLVDSESFIKVNKQMDSTK
ncbi:MAG TPA: efflux RND transporter periplasmic adaptor subunit [Chitinophagaceae bacterium]|nr:efflux RND transporter periplasmic adaptor subunit [Chitinophagaceae bacterium]